MSHALSSFWEATAASSLVVLTDFDYTITEVDVGDLITDTLAPPGADTLERFRAKQVGTRAYWLDSMARVEPETGLALADTVRVDPAFARFVGWCREQGVPLAVVSDGFGFYIRRILDREGLGDLPVFCNEMERLGELHFPNANPACDFCGCCKAQVVRKVRSLGARTVYVGDGVSDLYATPFADWVFARGSLARFLEHSESPYFPLGSFEDVHRILAADLASFRSGTAPGRVTHAPDPICRF